MPSLSQRRSIARPRSTLAVFLFDMNRFFRALVGRLLRDHLPDVDVSDEHSLAGMMRYLPHLNPRGRRARTPRPDFSSRDRSTIVSVSRSSGACGSAAHLPVILVGVVQTKLEP